MTFLACGGGAGPEVVAGDGGELARSRMAGGLANTVTGSSLDEVLPNHRTELQGHDISVSDALVLGRITEVELGRGYAAPTTEGATSGSPVDVSSDEADRRSAYLRLDIQRVIGHQEMEFRSGDEIRVGLTLDGGSIDADDVLASVQSIGAAIFFVRELPFGVDGTDDVLHLAFGGASTLAIEDDGRLTLPLYTMQAAALLPRRLVEIPDKGPVPTDLTLASLEELASRPVRRDVIDTTGAGASEDD